MPTYPTELSVDHCLRSRNPRIYHYELGMDTFNYDFWIRVTAHPGDNPNVSIQISINKSHPLLESPSETLNDYVNAPETHLNSLQLHILGELLDFLFWEDIIPKKGNAHLAYPDLALDKFSGTDPDQDAEAFIRLIDCKINSAVGTEPDETDAEHVIYLFRKKALFSSLLRGPAPEWYGSTIQDAKTWNDFRTLFITRFSDGSNKLRHRMEIEHCIRADGGETRNFLHRIKKNSGQRLARRYGWSRSSWTGRWTHQTSAAKKTKIYWLHTKRTDIYNEHLKNTWWNIQMQLGTFFQPT